MWLWAVKLFSKLTGPGPLLPIPNQFLALLTRDPPRGKSTARYQVVWAQKGFSAPSVETYRFPGCIGPQASRTDTLHRLCILPAIPRGAPSQAAQATEHQWHSLWDALAHPPFLTQLFLPLWGSGLSHSSNADVSARRCDWNVPSPPQDSCPQHPASCSDETRLHFFLTLGFVLEIHSPLSMSFFLKICAHILKIKVFYRKIRKWKKNPVHISTFPSSFPLK